MKQQAKIKAVIYARVSSKEQEETGYSLEAQEKLLQQHGKDKEFDIIKVYKVSESASGKQIRKTFIDMIDYVTRNKINVILCEKIDRLTRNLKDAATASDWIQDSEGREIHFVKENFVVNKHTRAHENLVWDMKVAIARFYTNNLSEEVKKGQKEKISQGGFPSRPPLGYKTIGEKGHKMHVIDDTVGRYITELYNLYATGNYSTVALCEKMYKLGLRSVGGLKVVKSQIHEILSNPFYCGQFIWKENNYEGSHEPLVSKDLFDQVQTKLRRGTAPYHNNGITELRGRIFCGSCNKTVTWESQKGHMYGGCKQCKTQLGEKSKYIRQEVVETELLARIMDVAPRNEKVMEVLTEALKESHAEEIKLHDTQVDNINNSLVRIQQRMRTMYTDRLDQRITVQEYDEKLSEFSEEKDTLLSSLEKLKSDNTEYYRVGMKIHEIAMRAKEIYGSKKATIEERRLLLSYAFSNITVLRGDIKPEYTKAFAFLAEWMPKLNTTLEPQKTFVNKRESGQFANFHPTVLPAWVQQL